MGRGWLFVGDVWKFSQKSSNWRSPKIAKKWSNSTKFLALRSKGILLQNQNGTLHFRWETVIFQLILLKHGKFDNFSWLLSIVAYVSVFLLLFLASQIYFSKELAMRYTCANFGNHICSQSADRQASPRNKNRVVKIV